MSSKKTENLGLHTWVSDDYVQMTEFNENFQKIDEKTGELLTNSQGANDKIVEITEQLAQTVLHLGYYGILTNVDDTDLLQSAIDSGYTNIIIPTATLNSVVFLDQTAYKLTLTGTITHKDGAKGDMFKSGVGTSFEIVGQGATLDGNFTNQVTRTSLINITGAKSCIVTNIDFKNIKRRAILGEQSDIRLLQVQNCNFLDAALHGGIAGQGTGFIATHGGDLTVIDRCTFKQTATPIAGQNRNPGGVFVSGQNPEKVIEVTNCHFENLGHNIAGNLESPLDIYSFARKVIMFGNTFKKSRFNPFRVTNTDVSEIKRNHVIQDVAIINDGGGGYADASCFSCGIVGRGFTVNNKDNSVYIIEENHFEINGVNCRAITASNDSLLYKVSKLISKNNIFRSSDGNTAIGIFANKVKDVIVEDCDIIGFNEVVRVQSTDLDALANEIASITVRKGNFKGTSGVYARTSVSNLNVMLDEINLFNTTQLPFTVRGAKNVTVRHCTLPKISTGDTSANAMFYFYNNDVNYTADPAGYSTNEYYRLYNNKGRADIASS